MVQAEKPKFYSQQVRKFILRRYVEVCDTVHSVPLPRHLVSGKKVVAPFHVVQRLKMLVTKHTVSAPLIAFLECCNLFLLRSGRDGIVGRVPRLGPAWTSRNRGSIPNTGKRFLLPSVETGSGDHPASYLAGSGSLSTAVKRPERQTDTNNPT